MKCIFIYNPSSGRQKIKKNIDYIESRLHERYNEVTIYETKSQEDLINTARDACDIYDVIFFSGGDGAFNNIIQGIMQKSHRPPLGYLPAGTVCDIGRNIGSSKNIKKALDVMLNGTPVNYDCGFANGKYFAYTLATGTFVSTSYMTSSSKKRKLGAFAYYFSAIKEFFKPTIKRIQFTHKGTIIKINTPLVLILNSRSIGGFPINRRAKLNSGKFYIYVIKNSKSKISGAFNIIRFYLRGFLGMKLSKIAYTMKEAECSFTSLEDMSWCVDGEEGPKNSVDVKYIPNAYRLIVNSDCLDRFLKR